MYYRVFPISCPICVLVCVSWNKWQHIKTHFSWRDKTTDEGAAAVSYQLQLRTEKVRRRFLCRRRCEKGLQQSLRHLRTSMLLGRMYKDSFIIADISAAISITISVVLIRIIRKIIKLRLTNYKHFLLRIPPRPTTHGFIRWHVCCWLAAVVLDGDPRWCDRSS